MEKTQGGVSGMQESSRSHEGDNVVRGVSYSTQAGSSGTSKWERSPPRAAATRRRTPREIVEAMGSLKNNRRVGEIVYTTETRKHNALDFGVDDDVPNETFFSRSEASKSFSFVDDDDEEDDGENIIRPVPHPMRRSSLDEIALEDNTHEMVKHAVLDKPKLKRWDSAEYYSAPREYRILLATQAKEVLISALDHAGSDYHVPGMTRRKSSLSMPFHLSSQDE